MDIGSALVGNIGAQEQSPRVLIGDTFFDGAARPIVTVRLIVGGDEIDPGEGSYLIINVRGERSPDQGLLGRSADNRFLRLPNHFDRWSDVERDVRTSVAIADPKRCSRCGNLGFARAAARIVVEVACRRL